MKINTHADLLKSLLAVTKPSDVYLILEQTGDRQELEAGELFGKQKYYWKYYGNRESNISTINLGSKPSRSLIERITNGIDAVFEKQMVKRDVPPTSPMDAAKKWFGRPPTTVDSGIFTWKEINTYEHDRHVQVVMLLGDEEASPTIDVLDSGVGILPENFCNTIVSLQEGNKLKKRYLAGAFGQGGSQTLAFCEYALIVSRCIQNPDVIGFTLVKLMRLGGDYKEDAYVYLAITNENGEQSVPSFQLDGASILDFYPTISGSERHKPIALNESGTLVRHYGYKLRGLEKTLNPAPGNLYHLFHYMMFDPLLPFRVIDLRKEGDIKNERITGSRNRLMDHTIREVPTGSTQLRHYHPREMISPASEVEPSIGIEYWVVITHEGTGIRSRSNRQFVEPDHPIVGTLNGQNQGELTAQILKELELSLVARHIIIHIDATQVSSEIRRQLFSSTREGFKEGEILNELTRLLTNILREDERLYEIERELAEQLLKKGSSQSSKEVKRQIAALLKGKGLTVHSSGDAFVSDPSGEEIAVAPPRKRFARGSFLPLPTLPYPQVTRFEIVYPRDMLTVYQQDNQLLKVETDANFQFDREEKIFIRIEPEYLEVAAKLLLRGGQVSWRLRPKVGASPGFTGMITVGITKKDGTQLTDSIPFEVLKPREERASRTKGLVPDFEIIPISPDEEAFSEIWEIESEQYDQVAYKVLQTAGRINIYYSTAFLPYKQQLEQVKRKPSLAQLFTENYEIWIGYHAILQWQQRKNTPEPEGIDSEQMEKIQERERALVAEMQVKQSFQIAEIQQREMKSKMD